MNKAQASPQPTPVDLIFAGSGEMARLCRELDEVANRAKADFLASMSHELRTPLNAIGGYVQLVEMGIHGAVTPAQQAALARVRASQQHLLSLINDVLAFAKVEAGQIELEQETLAADELFSSLETLLAPGRGEEHQPRHAVRTRVVPVGR